MAVILLSIVVLATPFIATTQGYLWKRCSIKPVEITLAPVPGPTGSPYITPFSQAWSYKYKYIIANDLTTTEWIGNLHTPCEDIPFTSILMMDVLVKAEENLETVVTAPMEPVACSWGMAVVKATWIIEGDAFEGQIIFKYDYVDAIYYGNFGPFDYWVPRPQLIECHYFGVLYGPIGQLRLLGTNGAGEFMTNFEGYMIEY